LKLRPLERRTQRKKYPRMFTEKVSSEIEGEDQGLSALGPETACIAKRKPHAIEEGGRKAIPEGEEKSVIWGKVMSSLCSIVLGKKKLLGRMRRNSTKEHLKEVKGKGDLPLGTLFEPQTCSLLGSPKGENVKIEG